MKGSITITSPTFGDGKEVISIQVKDETSRIRFLEVEIGYSDFTECLLGRSEIKCELKTRGLHNIGKNKETDKIEFKMPDGKGYNKDAAIKEAKKATPKGWECSVYFGSKNSFFTINNEYWAQTGIYRWVD